MTIGDVKYKGYGILASAEYDDSLNLWNGRYRILDQDGIVVYESFTTPLDEERDRTRGSRGRSARMD